MTEASNQLAVRLWRWAYFAALCAAVLATVLWLVFAVVIVSGPSEGITRPAIFTALNVGTIVAAGSRRPLWMLLSAFLAFLPSGLYTLLLPSPFAIIGVCNLVYMAAAILLLIARAHGVRQARA